MPGVPAMDSIKRAFKGVFKRGKKNKQDTERPQEQRPTASSAVPTTAAAPASAAAPQLPPVQNASPLQSPAAEDASKAVPPTHPPSTGPHTEPQDAVPQNHDLHANTASGAALAPQDTADFVRKQREESQLESTTATDGAKDGVPTTQNPTQTASHPAEGTNGSPVSATENIDSAAPPTKTDSAIGAQDQLVPDVDKENMQASANGERIAVTQDEPPPIKAVTAAPGMSATSGPLEDFPEGGDLNDEEHLS